MRKWLVLIAATSLVLGAAGVAGAAPLNWEGDATVIIADIPPFDFTGGGVATVNDSAGGVPAHLNTLRLKGSRGQIGGIGALDDSSGIVVHAAGIQTQLPGGCGLTQTASGRVIGVGCRDVRCPDFETRFQPVEIII